MSKVVFKKKMPKKRFEKKLIKEFGIDNLEVQPYSDEQRDEYGNYSISKLTLYRDARKSPISDTGNHIATWMKGEGWIFDHAYSGDVNA